MYAHLASGSYRKTAMYAHLASGSYRKTAMYAHLGSGWSPKSALGWPALTVGSLLVGMLALASESGRALGRPPARLMLDLPGTVVAIAWAAATIACLLLFAFLLALVRRRRKEHDERFALGGLLLLPLFILFAALMNEGSLEGLLSMWSGLSRPPVSLPPADAGIEPPVASLPLFTLAVGGLVLLLAATALFLAVWLVFGERLSDWWRSRAGTVPGPLEAAVAQSLDELRLDPDPRRAIIGCYRRFEHALARSRVPRAPWQTPLEFLRAALERLPLPADSVRALTQLFERARFSDEALGEADREAALEALLAIQASLDARVTPAPALAEAR
jgi:hypothetical protein